MTLIQRNDVSYATEVRHPKAEGYNALIGDRWWRTVTAGDVQIVVGSKDSLAQRQDQKGSIYENVLDLGYSFARTDMSGGEGLDWDPPEIPIETILTAQNPRRYWDSEGIDVSRPAAGDRYELRLARQFNEWNSTITPVTSLTSSRDYVFVNDGDTVRWYDTFANETEEGSAQIVAATDVIKIVATPDDRCIALLANGDLYKRDAGAASFTLLYDSTTGPHGDVQDVWYAKGRVIAWDSDGDLLEVPYDGSAVVVIEAMQSSLTVYSVVESGTAVVAAVSDGTLRTYSSVIVSGVPELTPAARTPAPKGEIPYLLGSNAGRLLYLTQHQDSAGTQTIRLYQATVLDDRYDYIIGEIQLRREWFLTNEVIDITTNMFSSRDSIIFVLDEAAGSSVWRYDLVTQGLSRLIMPLTTGVTSAVVEFDDQIAFVSTATDTVYLESETLYVDEGWLITPNITFGLNTKISWLASVIEGSDLVAGGTQIELLRSSDPTAILDKDSPSWAAMQSLSSQDASGTEQPLVGVQSRTLALQVRIHSTTANTISPKLTRIAIRGIPSHRDRILLIPINVSDYVSVPGRKPKRIVGLGDQLQRDLRALLGTSVEVHTLNPTVDMRGIVNTISQPVSYVSKRGSVTRYCLVEIRGQELTGSGVSQGSGGIGMEWFGMATIGIGEE